ncbi:MAG: histidine kinase N-terminal 7TM domain-containing protein [Natrialbaceae archaeon]|nr:histidine kinase N-terminal 7TM domain-containing protein [Natrialbaceae archaeon]
MLDMSPIAGLSIFAGLVSLGLAGFVWRRLRDRPGSMYWVGAVATMGLWALFYGSALMVFDPILREWLEALIWLPRVLAPPFVLAFAFAYTGRSELIRSPLMELIVAFQLGNWVLYATNPFHGWMWTGYEVERTLGAAAGTYELAPVMWVGATVAYIVLASGIYLLLEAVLEYGQLYRRQLAALVLGVAVPGIATGFWLLGFGPWGRWISRRIGDARDSGPDHRRTVFE